MSRKKDHDSLLIEVKKILWENWDPIGLRGAGPADKYDGYAPTIVKLLQMDADVDAIATTLAHFSEVNLGLNKKTRYHEDAAIRLFELVSL